MKMEETLNKMLFFGTEPADNCLVWSGVMWLCATSSIAYLTSLNSLICLTGTILITMPSFALSLFLGYKALTLDVKRKAWRLIALLSTFIAISVITLVAKLTNAQ